MPEFFTKTNLSENKEVEDNTSLDPTNILFNWTAPTHPFRKKDRSYYITVAIIVVLLISISLLSQEILLIGVILAISFVAYVLAFVPPKDIEYKISNQGVTIADKFYFWDELDSFWFSKKEGYFILNVFTKFRYPAQLMMVLEGQDTVRIKNKVVRFLPFHEIAPKSLMDGWAEWLQKTFPLENSHK